MATKSVLGGDYSLDERTDDELVALARTGGSRTGAWDELYRRHASSARSVARHILHSRQDADDVVNDAFAGVIAAIGRGSGPTSNFRHYLMACVRNGCKKRAWRGGATVSTDPNVLEQRHGAVFEDPEQFGEAGLVANAFSSLSTDWQRALWLTAVEERPTEEVARELGRRPAAVAALAHRAREAFAEAYLSQHQQRVLAPSCERIGPKLAHYVRGRAGDIDTARVEHHLKRCVECSHAVDELRDVNSALRSLALPATLAGAGSLVAVGAPVAGVGAAGWLASLLGGSALAKAAVIAALVVPAAVFVSETDRSDHTTVRDSAAEAAGADAAGFGFGGAGDSSDPDASTGPSSVGPDDHRPIGSITLSTGSSSDPATSTVVQPATSESGDPSAASVASTTVAAVATIATVPSRGVTVPAPVPTVPAPTVPATIAVTLPGISTPPLATPAITTPPVVLPGIITPTITVLPAITTPALDTPLLSVPSISVPAVTVPQLSIPPVTILPAISIPAISIPPLAVTPLTIAELPLPSLPPLPLPKLPLPNLLGS